VAGAQFFHFMCELFIKHVLGVGKKHPGLYGKTTTYYGTVEQQGRLTLHLHLLLWILNSLSRTSHPSGLFVFAKLLTLLSPFSLKLYTHLLSPSFPSAPFTRGITSVISSKPDQAYLCFSGPIPTVFYTVVSPSLRYVFYTEFPGLYSPDTPPSLRFLTSTRNVTSRDTPLCRTLCSHADRPQHLHAPPPRRRSRHYAPGPSERTSLVPRRTLYALPAATLKVYRQLKLCLPQKATYLSTGVNRLREWL